ncbi:pyridoxamine 5'-phosphate oxidase family protein [Gymnodinialimonas ceratoperidinii]|uniref:Pyridoxamine 5'-phosphate oxidase family protein n=1 Tax=Gymnodinialimonas ceratoperidinii TaxID=2856823 RepID=A0A8F6TXI3_9RHOB|nr:pyridoxamine 5'-phosphate oxidase family protein [Gymnodinialimonas ceratoperidinii]QXT39753.1 pyridoxamine 5'-phosphate oxidase family protein [Gymnodinialimonas ceratoperidinii]
MKTITDTDALAALYGAAVPASLSKVVPRLTPSYRKWIDAARFVVLSTVGPEGTDASPRGDDGPVVRIVDDRTLMMPDWRGNNRIDSLRNIVRDGRVSLMFMVPGSGNVVRINGTAVLTADPSVTETFEQRGNHPKTVIVITAEEIYFQCAKAIMRSGLWSRDDAAGLPKAGDFISEVDPEFDGKTYDAEYPVKAPERMW